MQKSFGSIVAGAVASLALSGVALADGKTAAPATGKAAAPAATTTTTTVAAGKCTSNECGGKVAGSHNTCKGQEVPGVTKEQCEKDGKGTWTDAAAKTK
jgi:hypothetical protein